MYTLSKAAQKPVTILLIIIMGVFIFLTIGTYRNTDRLKVVVYSQCLDAQKSSAGINTVLTTLINATHANTLLTLAEKIDRTKKYTQAMVPVLRCTPP